MFVEKRILFLVRFFLAALTVFLIFPETVVFGAPSPQLLVKAIEIQGNKRVDRNSILIKLKTREGEPFSVEKAREDVKALYQTGFFEDVKVDAQPFEGGVRLVYIVKERPLVGRVLLSGNKKLKDKDIKKELKSFPFSIYNENIVKENIDKIKQMYQAKGYYSTKVELVKKEKRGVLELVYQIHEGQKAHVAKIDFVGNKHFSDGELKKQMLTKEKNIWNMVTTFVGQFLGKPSTYYYIPDLFKVDLMKVREYYRDHGFIRVAIGEPEIKVEKKGNIFIRVPIEEGPRYKVSQVNLRLGKGDPFESDDLVKILRLKPKEWYGAAAMRKDVDNLTDLYGSRGYVNADVRPFVDVDDKDHTVSVTYRIEKGEKYYVGRIEVQGNVKTRDKVIRREVGLAEGDVMNTLALKTAKERLNRLGYFSQVDIETKPGEDHLENVVVNVKEQPTGSLMLGGGYSTLEALGLAVQLQEKNLFGRGQSVSLSGNFSGRSTEYQLSFFDPYILDRPFSLGVMSHHVTYEYDTFDETSTGLTVTLGRRIWNWYTHVSVAYDFESVDISSVDNDAPKFIHDQRGRSASSAVVFGLTQDTRNSTVLPTKGFQRSLSLKVAGLGGDEYYYKVMADAGYFISANKLIKNSVFHVRGRLGFLNPLPLGNKDRPIYERFFVGGEDTVRGFKEDEASPSSHDEAYGGTKELIFNFEYLFPLVGGLRGLVFYDTGAAFDNGVQFLSLGALRHSVGAGIRFVTPFGPLKVDLGYKLDKKKGENPVKVEFSAGTAF